VWFVEGREPLIAIVRRRTAQNKKGNAMETSEVQTLKKANAILRTWTRRHNRAGVLMAIPLVAGFIMMSAFPSALTDIVMAVAPAIALTTGMFLIPEDFRSRRGSLIPAICLVAAMWAAAIVVALFRLIG